MKQNLFHHLKEHFAFVARELSSQARQAGLFTNPTDVGTQREEVYRRFLERYLPKTCEVFLGGYVFDNEGNCSDQIDIIVTGSNGHRFRMSDGDRYISTLVGTIGMVEVKSKLDKNSIEEALRKCASIPPMPDPKGIVSPTLNVGPDWWYDWPYKIIVAFDGIDPDTLCTHIANFYCRNPDIPDSRRPNLIHVLEKYVVARPTSNLNVVELGTGIIQPVSGSFFPMETGSDVSAMVITLLNLQEKVNTSNHLIYKHGELHNKLIEQIKLEH